MLYTNYETKKMVENTLDSVDVYTDAMMYIDDHGKFTAETIERFLIDHPCVCRTYEGIDWQQVADKVNKAY